MFNLAVVTDKTGYSAYYIIFTLSFLSLFLPNATDETKLFFTEKEKPNFDILEIRFTPVLPGTFLKVADLFCG